MAILLMYCILLAFMQSGSQAFNNFTVGGENNWVVPNDTNAEIYNQWAGRNRFKVGDSLVFVYNSNEDSVLQVTHQKYVSCNTSDPINKFQDGYTVFKLNQSGSFYFISGANGHCQKSQKLHVVVMAIRGVTPPSSPPQFPPVPAPAPVVPAHVPAPAPAPLIMMATPAPSPAPSMVPAVPPTRGYSQGGEIMDVALCGGGDPNQGYTNTAVQLSSSAVNMVKAAIFMGDPMFRAGLSYDVGTCAAGGFDQRPAGFSCPSASKIKSYCDASDPYCCNGNNAATHQGYGSEYGSQALAFIKSKLG